MRAYPTTADVVKFWSRVIVGPPDTCWMFLGGEMKKKYGQICFGNTTMTSHRFAYYLTHGELPEGMDICHHCDQPACVNPSHLYAGTRAENLRDMTVRNRRARGDSHGSRTHPERVRRGEIHSASKLTEYQVKEIRRLYRPRVTTVPMLAAQFGVSRGTVFAIIQRKTWAHVE